VVNHPTFKATPAPRKSRRPKFKVIGGERRNRHMALIYSDESRSGRPNAIEGWTLAEYDALPEYEKEPGSDVLIPNVGYLRFTMPTTDDRRGRGRHRPVE
jgi:hypothetical protein